MDWHSIVIAIFSTGTAGKVLSMACRSMPAPRENSPYLLRWVYDFAQLWGDNDDKLGLTRPPKEPSQIIARET